jgi:hypothetical protein
MAFDASYKEPTGTASPTGAASTDGQYAQCTSGGDFSLSQECIMKIRWALFSAAILIGFLPSQVTLEEAVLGQGNISCGSLARCTIWVHIWSSRIHHQCLGR